MVTVNCDMGEGYSLYQIGDDEGLMPLIDVANVACGFHGSDFDHMRATVELAKRHGVKVGAHPSLPDRQGFGRRDMAMSRAELVNCMIYQIGALKGFLEAADMPLNHIKPHGSLYGMAARLEHVAEAVCDVADVFKVPIFGMVGTLHEEVYAKRGHEFVAEYYSDLEYDAGGNLIVTRKHDAVDAARAARRCVRAIEEGLTESIEGSDVKVGAETICVHSDTPNAVDVAKAVSEAVAEYRNAA